MKKILIGFLGFVSLSTFADSLDCLSGYESNENHTYKPIAVCNEIVASNVEDQALLKLDKVNVCIVQDEEHRGLFKKTHILVSGSFNATFVNSENSHVVSGFFSKAKIKKEMPKVVRATQKYLNRIEIDIYDSTTDILTTEIITKSRPEVKAILKCNKF